MRVRALRSLATGLMLSSAFAACHGPIGAPPAPYAGEFNATSVSPYEDVNYSPSGSAFTAFRTRLIVDSMPYPYAPYSWGFHFAFANKAQAEIRLSVLSNYIGTRGAALFLFKSGARSKKGNCPSAAMLSCVVAYPWVTGRPYVLSVSLSGRSGATETWKAFLIDRKRAVTIVTFVVPKSWGLLRATAQIPWVLEQSFGGTLARCSFEPYARTIVENPVVQTGSAPAKPLGIASAYVNACTSNAVLNAGPGDASATIQTGIAWRPGGTPTPSPSPPVGAPLFTPLPFPSGGPQHVTDPIRVGKPELAISPALYGMANFPDEAISTLRFRDDTYRMWFVGSGSLILNSSVYLMASRDLRTFTPVPPNPNDPPYMFPVYDPEAPGTEAFDADYAGPGTVTPGAHGDLLMIYHGENHLIGGMHYGLTPFYATVGLARSTDDGETWSRIGAIITGISPKPNAYFLGGAGAANPTAIAVDGYLYCIYSDFGAGNGTASPRGLAIARTPLSADANPGTWQKYYNGSFSTDALHHGNFSALTTLSSTVPAAQFPSVSYNRYLNAFLMLVNGSDGLHALVSSDLITWSGGRLVIPLKSPFNLYAAAVSAGENSNQVSDQTGYIYVTLPPDGRAMFRYPFAIGNAPLP